MRKPSRNLPVASKTSVLAAEKTGQVLVRTSPHPGHTESPVISGKKVGYVRRSEHSRSCLHDSHLLSGLSWRSNEHNTGTEEWEGPEFLARRSRGAQAYLPKSARRRPADSTKLSGGTAMEPVPPLDVLMVAERQFRRPGKTFMASSRT
ncbi:MAG: hypothetical protein WAV78_35895, partial [Xanthobacteraceae bacterium]